MKALEKEHSYSIFTYDQGTRTIVFTEGTGYEQIQSGILDYAVSETYFDMAGMTHDEKTLFFEGAAMQEILPPAIDVGTAGDQCAMIDIMCTKPLTDNDVLLYSNYANIVGDGSVLTFDQTIYGRVRVFNMDLDNLAGGYFITLGDNQTGSLEATASDRIYCYRMVVPSVTADSRITITGARYLLRARAIEEPEYEYLMRLKRSFELQNEPDRD